MGSCMAAGGDKVGKINDAIYRSLGQFHGKDKSVISVRAGVIFDLFAVQNMRMCQN